jgi:hypothetical protein
MRLLWERSGHRSKLPVLFFVYIGLSGKIQGIHSVEGKWEKGLLFPVFLVIYINN